jgi:hypothetical protein
LANIPSISLCQLSFLCLSQACLGKHSFDLSVLNGIAPSSASASTDNRRLVRLADFAASFAFRIILKPPPPPPPEDDEEEEDLPPLSSSVTAAATSSAGVSAATAAAAAAAAAVAEMSSQSVLRSSGVIACDVKET